MNSAPPQGDVFGLNSMPGDDPFAPKAPPPPTHQDFTNAILGAYQNAPPAAPTANGAPVAAVPGQPQPPTPTANGAAPAPMSMTALANTAAEEAPMTELEKAMKNLVNVDHIDSAPLKLTMKKEEPKRKSPKGKSVPLPPVASTMVGAGATLSQIRSTNHGVRHRKHTESKYRHFIHHASSHRSLFCRRRHSRLLLGMQGRV